MDSRAEAAWVSPGGEVSLSADTAPHATLAVSTYADRSLREERVALNRAEARVTALARERQQALEASASAGHAAREMEERLDQLWREERETQPASHDAAVSAAQRSRDPTPVPPS